MYDVPGATANVRVSSQNHLSTIVHKLEYRGVLAFAVV